MEKINWDECDDDTMIGSSSGEGKMVIKLKIPMIKLAEPEKTLEDDQVIGILSSKSVEQDGKKICLECKKVFSSGKALGGHMRVHLPNKNPNFLKPPKTNKFIRNQDHNNGDRKPYYMNSVNHEGKPTCSQCGKTFPSMKSLFGHMRCHPERVWRGILPPPNTAAAAPAAVARCRASSYSSSSIKNDNDAGDQVVDLTKFLRRWPVTERRGRKAVKVDKDEDDVVLQEAVEDLMSLANSGGASVFIEQHEKLYDNCYGVGKRKAGEIDGKPPAKPELEDGQSDSNEQLLINYKFKKTKNPMMELEPNDVVNGESTPQQQPVVTECKYKCTTCNKCFATHQALGGHRSSHNKSKLTSADRHPTEEPNLSGDNSSIHQHQCKICDKIFATGQALGGHQRCHWTGTTTVSSQITSAGDGGSQTGCDRKVADFDLNEIPMEEDEGGNGNGNSGYASSSYNSNIIC